jgi:hypothetical protein
MSEKAPYVHRFQVPTEGAATAVDDTVILGEAPFAGTVTEVNYIPDAALTGANTNTRRLALINRGQAGAGATIVAELQFNAGINLTAGDETAITLSATPANLVLVAGDVLAWFSDAVGTGIADAGGVVQVSISRS